MAVKCLLPLLTETTSFMRYRPLSAKLTCCAHQLTCCAVIFRRPGQPVSSKGDRTWESMLNSIFALRTELKLWCSCRQSGC